MEWRKQTELASLQFLYWSLHFELSVLIFLRFLRLFYGTSNYTKTHARRSHHCFFALDRANYVRWLDKPGVFCAAHEQNNKVVKGNGGAFDITESLTQLMYWMVSRPEMSRIINEFEFSQELLRSSSDEHTESIDTTNKQKECKALSEVRSNHCAMLLIK